MNQLSVSALIIAVMHGGGCVCVGVQHENPYLDMNHVMDPFVLM